MLIRASIAKTLILVMLAMPLISVATTYPYWDVAYPANTFDGCIAGQAVATNGTVYALDADSAGGALLSWTQCSGWVVIAELADGNGGTTLGEVLDLTPNGRLYVGGNFGSVTAWTNGGPGLTTYATNIAYLNLQTGVWSGVGLGNAGLTFNPTEYKPVYALAVDAASNVYVGLFLTNLDSDLQYYFTNTVLKYDNTNDWRCVGGSLSNYTGCDATEPSVISMFAQGLDIYMTGNILGGYNEPGKTGWVGSTNVIKWSGASNKWVTMGTSDTWGGGVHGGVGMNCYNSGIRSLAVSGSNVFVTGTWYDTDGSQNTHDICHYSTNGTWLPSTNMSLFDFNPEQAGVGYALTVQKGAVFIAGNFNAAGSPGNICNSVAKWTNGGWGALGSGLQYYTGVGTNYYVGTVDCLAADSDAVYVIGDSIDSIPSFNTAGGDTNVLSPGVRWITAAGEDPCETTSQIIDVNFQLSGQTKMVGPAAFGMTSTDYWNLYLTDAACSSQPYTNINNLTNVFGHATSVSMSIGSSQPKFGSYTTGLSDDALLDYCYSSTCGTNSITITLTNLSSAGFVRQGARSFDIYVYGFGGTHTIGGTVYCRNGVFTAEPEDITVPTARTYTGWPITDWVEKDQYVLFSNLTNGPGGKITITAALDPGNPIGDWYLNGIQIVPVYP